MPPPASTEGAPLRVKPVPNGTVRGALMTAVGACVSVTITRAVTGADRLPAESTTSS